MWAAVAPKLEPGERVVMGAVVQTGPSQWWAMLTWIITALTTRYWFLVVTDRRIVILPASKRPKPIQWTAPLGRASIQNRHLGTLWSSFVIRGSDGTTGKYRYLQRLWAAEMDRVVELVNGATQPQPFHPQPARQPPQPGGFTG
jgi:hypothetical protein